MNTSSIYIHIPFCVKKCLYCDFASYAGKESLIAPYVEALRAEISLWHPDGSISTVYFGGGTPNILSPDQLLAAVEDIRRCFHVEADAEVTVEVNPGIGDGRQTTVLPPRDLFNRLSLGVQSLHDDELRLLGRIHSAGEAVRAFRDAREAGFGNISIDLMYGIPGQTAKSWKQTLDGVLSLGPEHVSLYSLTVEEGTPFWDMCRAGRLELPGSDAEADMYEEAIRTLVGAGFVHYEISNFARPGFESRHNITYWKNEPYFGFGAGATSYLDGTRAANVREIEEYIRRIQSGESLVEFEERLAARDSMGETIFLGLRMLSGVDKAAFMSRYGISLDDAFPSQIEALMNRGLIQETDGAIRLTHIGLLFANDVFAEFVAQ
jgi:oxygen-independent coproporphyrinogen III oxidase